MVQELVRQKEQAYTERKPEQFSVARICFKILSKQKRGHTTNLQHRLVQETAGQKGRAQAGLVRTAKDEILCHTTCPKNWTSGDVYSREKGCSLCSISVLILLTTLFDKALCGYISACFTGYSLPFFVYTAQFFVMSCPCNVARGFFFFLIFGAPTGWDNFTAAFHV